jgi:LPXTG-motif cell wall-anchored protein
VIGAKGTLRGLALVAATALLAMPIGLAPANAEPDYPPSFYAIQASSFTAKVHTALNFTAQTYKKNSDVSVNVTVSGDEVGSQSVSADRKGIAHAKVTFDKVGTNVVTMSGTSDTGAPLALSANITVTEDGDVTTVNNGGTGGNGDNGTGGDNGSSGGDNNTTTTTNNSTDGGQADAASGIPFFGGGLPRTGGDIAATVLIGLVLLAGGGLLVFAARRRRA